MISWCVAVFGATDAERDTATDFLSELIGSARNADNGESGQRLYQVVYWLWVMGQSGMSPEDALNAAAQRRGAPLSELCRRQLLADWHIASSYGLLTPENLSLLRAGEAPTASAGRFAGRRVDVVKIQARGSFGNLANLALCPASVPIPDEARANTADLPPSQPTPHPALPMTAVAMPPVAPRGSALASKPRPPRSGSSGNTPAVGHEQVELHDVPFNGSLPLGGTRKLAVASDSGSELSVSIIGDGPPVTRTYNLPSGGSISNVYPRIQNSKVPKVNPVHLPGVSDNAYLIHSEGAARYYFVDAIVNNGSAFRIAKVVGSP